MLSSLVVSAATAGRLRTTEKNFEVIWGANLSESKTNLSWVNNASGTITCPFTLSGSFVERTIAKSSGAKIAEITRAAAGTCVSGGATVLAESLPWEMRYVGFTGTLPNIITVTTTIVGMSLSLESGGGISCIFRTSVTEPFVGIITRFGVMATENYRAEEASRIGLGGTGCNLLSPARSQGTGLLRNLAGGALKITLI